jgi:glyoxylase-like metal-dependent hydrolase (beta-lactamase superfamily II)
MNNLLFPESLIYAPQESYDWCASLYADVRDHQNWEKLVLRYYPEAFDYERTRIHMHKLRKVALRWWDAKRLGARSRFRWLENQQLPDGLECMMTSGHVPGHASISVRTGAGPVLVAGDALLSRDHGKDILTMIPVNRRQFELDRRRLIGLEGRIIPGHDHEFVTPAQPLANP